MFCNEKSVPMQQCTEHHKLWFTTNQLSYFGFETIRPLVVCFYCFMAELFPVAHSIGREQCRINWWRQKKTSSVLFSVLEHIRMSTYCRCRNHIAPSVSLAPAITRLMHMCSNRYSILLRHTCIRNAKACSICMNAYKSWLFFFCSSARRSLHSHREYFLCVYVTSASAPTCSPLLCDFGFIGILHIRFFCASFASMFACTLCFDITIQSLWEYLQLLFASASSYSLYTRIFSPLISIHFK